MSQRKFMGIGKNEMAHSSNYIYIYNYNYAHFGLIGELYSITRMGESKILMQPTVVTGVGIFQVFQFCKEHLPPFTVIPKLL